MPPGVVESYLDSVVTHDWARLSTLLRDDILRVGPYGDTYSGRADYVGFLEGLMPTLPGYSMSVQAVTYTGGGQRAFAELMETVTVDGKPHVTPEVLVFDIDADGLIAHIAIYIQRHGRA